MNIPKLSILIPIYNVEKFLPSCLDSVLSQTMSDLEIICINDGSTDSCGEILSDYASRDDRIKVINKPNTGYGHSMNIGLDNATGEYVGIVESDDRIEPDFFANLYKITSDNNLDILKCECKFVWDSEGYSFRYHAEHLNKYFCELITKDRLWLRCQFLMNIWAGIYRRDFLVANNIRFNETPGASYQDNGFWLQGMIFADRVMFTDEAGYLYRQDNTLASIKDPRKIYTMVDEYEWLADHLKEKISQRQMDVVNAFRLIRGYWSFFRIDDSKKREFCDRLISDYIKYGSVFTTDFAWQELFYQITSDTDGFCKRVIDAKKDIESRIDKVESIIIYGAGKRGQKLFRLMCDRGWRNKLQCFVETEKPDKESIATVQIYKYDSGEVNYSNSLVVISAADDSKMAQSMREKCEEIGITNVIGSNGFFDNYYELT